MKKTETIILDKDVFETLIEKLEQQGISLDDYINDVLKEHIKEISKAD